MNPSLEYLFQYPVKSLKSDGTGYAIEFDDNTPGDGPVIGVEGENLVVPSEDVIVGKQLITVTYSADSTVMYFGRSQGGQIVDQISVSVNPTDVYIVDPRFNGEPFYPARFVPKPTPSDSIREQFNDRFADGPEPQDEETVTELPQEPSDA